MFLAGGMCQNVCCVFKMKVLLAISLVNLGCRRTRSGTGSKIIVVSDRIADNQSVNICVIARCAGIGESLACFLEKFLIFGKLDGLISSAGSLKIYLCAFNVALQKHFMLTPIYQTML